MGYHAADFLAGLFQGAAPATDPDAPGPEPQAVPTAKAKKMYTAAAKERLKTKGGHSGVVNLPQAIGKARDQAAKAARLREKTLVVNLPQVIPAKPAIRPPGRLVENLPPTEIGKAPDQAARAVGGDYPEALDFARWVLRPDARGRLGWELPDVPDAERWWADPPAAGEPLPGVVAVGDAPSFPGDHAPAPACLRCGSLELWWDLWGGVHCRHCDARAFERGLRLLERAERLRGRYGTAPATVATLEGSTR